MEVVGNSMEVACERQLDGQGEFAEMAGAHMNHALDLLQWLLNLGTTVRLGGRMARSGEMIQHIAAIAQHQRII